MRRTRNKKVKKSIVKSGSMGLAALLLTLMGAGLVYYRYDSQCTAITRQIGQAERRHAALVDECVREAARWDELKITERLTEKLNRFGLEMRYAHQDQIVRMTADGRPAVGQIAVARAKNRVRTADVARR